MSDDVINLGSFILEGEPPLSSHITEKQVSFYARDGAIITGIADIPTHRPITQKALFLHEIEGNADGGSMRVLARRYANMGIATLRIDFRGHGERKTQWEQYSPQSMYEDAISSLDWLDHEWPDIEKTILCGFSTGGAIATMVRAADARIAATCLLYPVLSFKYNFLAASYPETEQLLPIKEWDALTPWRAVEFTKEKLEASVNDGARFSLTSHTYGAFFIKGCKDMVDRDRDIPYHLFKGKTPITIIQGTEDFCVPEGLTDLLCRKAQEKEMPVRLARMNGMNHWVPREWKQSVIKQFKKAVSIEPASFKPQTVTVSIRSQRDFSSPDLQSR